MLNETTFTQISKFSETLSFWTFIIQNSTWIFLCLLCRHTVFVNEFDLSGNTAIRKCIPMHNILLLEHNCNMRLATIYLKKATKKMIKPEFWWEYKTIGYYKKALSYVHLQSQNLCAVGHTSTYIFRISFGNLHICWVTFPWLKVQIQSTVVECQQTCIDLKGNILISKIVILEENYLRVHSSNKRK